VDPVETIGKGIFMSESTSRRVALKTMAALAGGAAVSPLLTRPSLAAERNPAWEKSMEMGCKWIAKAQSNVGHWTASNYPTAMTALGAIALICSGSTTTQGPYAKNIRRAVDYLISTKARPNGLIGDPRSDNRYTYGHGFSMLFLSQILGEEEDDIRRKELIDVLTKAVEFSGNRRSRRGHRKGETVRLQVQEQRRRHLVQFSQYGNVSTSNHRCCTSNAEQRGRL
jgi:hypothetical protein